MKKLIGIEHTIRMNRLVTENDPISPGGYELLFDTGESIQFDFMDTYQFHDNDMVTHQCEHLDVDSFPDAEKLAELLQNHKVIKLVEFYVDVEGCESEIHPLSIDNFYFEFDDGSSVSLDENIIKAYNFDW